jgi:uncharacterized membrane protein (DUF485 family)
MLNIIENIKRKSPQERFLLVIGLLFFVIYVIFGVIIILWKNFPISLQPKWRITLGIVLIIYGFTRLLRVFKQN